MATCGYPSREWEEDFECALAAGHEGDHRCILTWPTRVEDICRAEGHVWGEWESVAETRTHFSRLEWEVNPEAYRECGRCRVLDFEGGKRRPGIADILLANLIGTNDTLGLLPIGAEFTAKVEWAKGLFDDE